MAHVRHGVWDNDFEVRMPKYIFQTLSELRAKTKTRRTRAHANCFLIEQEIQDSEVQFSNCVLFLSESPDSLLERTSRETWETNIYVLVYLNRHSSYNPLLMLVPTPSHIIGSDFRGEGLFTC